MASPDEPGYAANPDIEPGTTDEDHDLAEVSQALWERYERDVADFVASSDPNATVVHNKKIAGKQSGRLRQVDVLVTGTLAGHEVSFAVECKRNKNPIGIGVVHEFAGKLADLGVEFGVMYAFSGVGKGATARAAGARQPKIELRSIPTPDVVLPPWTERLPAFTGFGDCPNDNCMTGDITWRAWPQTDSDAASRREVVGFAAPGRSAVPIVRPRPGLCGSRRCRAMVARIASPYSRTGKAPRSRQSRCFNRAIDPEDPLASGVTDALARTRGRGHSNLFLRTAVLADTGPSRT